MTTVRIHPTICDRCKQVVIGPSINLVVHPQVGTHPMVRLCSDCGESLSRFLRAAETEPAAAHCR